MPGGNRRFTEILSVNLRGNPSLIKMIVIVPINISYIYNYRYKYLYLSQLKLNKHGKNKHKKAFPFYTSYLLFMILHL